MAPENGHNCPDHTGQEERIKGVSGKLTLVIWLLGILIGGTAVLYSSLQVLNNSIANVGARFSSIEAKLTILEATDQRTGTRLDRLENGIK